MLMNTKLWGFLDERNNPISAVSFNTQTFKHRARPGDYTALLAYAESAGLKLLYVEADLDGARGTDATQQINACDHKSKNPAK